MGGGTGSAGADEVDATDAAGSATAGRALHHAPGLHGPPQLHRPVHLEGLPRAHRQVNRSMHAWRQTGSAAWIWPLMMPASRLYISVASQLMTVPPSGVVNGAGTCRPEQWLSFVIASDQNCFCCTDDSLYDGMAGHGCAGL